MKNLIISSFLIYSLSLSSCINQKRTYSNTKIFKQKIDTSALFQNSHVGIYIYDPISKEKIYSKNEDKYFVPASNTKILTLYACLKTLGDSIPALKYFEKEDTLFILGTSDPTFLHPDFPLGKTFAFLKNSKSKTIAFSAENFKNESFGIGWSWDDYNDYYQPEISAFPMYGNILRVSNNAKFQTLNPSYFASNLKSTELKSNEIKRVYDENVFYTNYEIQSKNKFNQDIPFKTSTNLTVHLLVDTLKKNVITMKIKHTEPYKTLFSLPVDTVYRRMMQVSDNMLAEHLLLVAGGKYSNEISSKQSINNIQNNFLLDFPQKFKWVDGSGLSRYNLFTPKSLVVLLERMWNEFSKEKIYSYMSIGGQVGTLKNTYNSKIPFVYAKTGTLSGVYNQSGYLICKSGKTFIFSFMNNNFVDSTSKYRIKTSELLTWIHENY